MSTAVSKRSVAAASAQGQSRPRPPSPKVPPYLGLAFLALVAFGLFCWTWEGDAVLFFPLGDVVLWAPRDPLIGLIIMVMALLICFKLRISPMGAFGGLALIAITYWAGSNIHFIDRIAEVPGRLTGGNTRQQLLGYFNPDWSYLFLHNVAGTSRPIWGEWLITLCMAVVATIIGCFIGLLLAMLASPVSSLNKGTSQTIKAINSVVRSIPDVAWALLFAAFIGGTAYGLGALAAVLALIMFNIGIVAKLLSESIDAIQPGPLEAADAAGANLIQRDRVAVLPAVMPSFISYSLYVFELNIRASAALGVVGVAGIGGELSRQIGRMSQGYENVGAILWALVFVVLLVDLLSLWIRRKLL
ncbi:PhnE/PtxC family ABC transporter permease [Nesterenkonia haasae]|uniref:PhnE/PtxC family ABC transporter permease n=1 Tax=Nesterenkonia haasae TaxID=2587813 RepID=UPI001390D8C5|nr:ABC transporter permease subunit [Nesterenkonia haasae]NDK31507.1 ABC transporter permease subunit [Nesterenkonia haasae]